MSNISITFLGTGGVMGIPIWNCDCSTCKSDNEKNRRFRSSIFVKINEKNILIDMGQDLRSQLIKHNIKRLDYAFLTHTHGDHIHGIEQLSTADNVIFETPEDVLNDISDESKRWLKARNKSMSINVFSAKIIEGVLIDTIKLQHDKDYTENKCPCYGYLFKGDNFKFAYMSDFNKILEPEKLFDLDLIICDGSRMEDNGIGHIGIIRGAEEVYKVFKPKQMVFTHIHHSTEHEQTNEYLKQFGNLSLAYDGLVITNKNNTN